jgi:hypothetical protein
MKIPRSDPWSFLNKLVQVTGSVGSPEHKEFAAMARQWQAERSPEEMTFAVMGILLKAFEAKGIHDDMAISTMRDMSPFIVGSAWWAELGFPSVTLTHDFYRAIAVTDFGEVGDDPLLLPFPAFVVRLPESLRGKDASTPLFCYPVPTQRVPSPADGSRLPLFSEERNRAIRPDEVSFDVTRMTLTPEPDEDAMTRASYTQWTNGVPYNIFLTGRVEAIDALDPLEARVTSAMGQSFDPELTKRARRVIANTMLYINSNGGLPPEKKVGADVPVEREHKTEPRFRVGRPIKLGAKLKAAIREGLSGGASWKLESRFVVRGHWRNQAYGPEHSLRRKQWIEPYWKGPEDVGEALERTFEVT